MLKRGSASDVQCEEYANFVRESEFVDVELRGCLRVGGKVSDAAAKAFVKGKMANRILLLSGGRKMEVVGRRTGTDVKLQEMYYNTRFK